MNTERSPISFKKALRRGKLKFSFQHFRREEPLVGCPFGGDLVKITCEQVADVKAQSQQNKAAWKPKPPSR